MVLRDDDDYVDAARLWRAPIEFSEEYPGASLRYSYVFDAGTDDPLESLGLVKPRPGKRLGNSWVCDPRTGKRFETLDRHLRSHGAQAMADRVPVLAYGSNANPGQLLRKFGSIDTSRHLVVGLAALTGIEAVYTAMKGYYGSIPATVSLYGNERHLFAVTWLDGQQLSVMTETEPGYDFRWLSGDTHKISIHESKEPLAQVYAFVSKTGSLTDETGSVITVEREWIPQVSTGKESWAGEGSRIGQKRTQAKAHTAYGLVGSSRTSLVAEPLVGTARDPAEAESYGVVGQGFQPPEGQEPSSLNLVATETTSLAIEVGRPRHRFCCFLHPATHQILGQPMVVLVSAEQTCPVPVSVVVTDRVSPANVGLDITVRFGIGCLEREIITVAPSSVRWRSNLSDLVLPVRRTMVRVKPSHGWIAERNAAYVDPDTLDYLGLDSGDRLAIEVPQPGSMMTLQVFALPAHLISERAGVEAMYREAKFPRCDAILGAESNLPEIWIDAEDRNRLQVGVCDALVVRAFRPTQIVKSMQELFLVVIAAAVGLAAVGSEIDVQVGGFRLSGALAVGVGFVLCLVFMIGVAYLSLRRKLS